MVCHFFISIKEADWGECEVHGVKAVEGELHIWFAKQRKEKTNKENENRRERLRAGEEGGNTLLRHSQKKTGNDSLRTFMKR
jgi:hypothetical protein